MYETTSCLVVPSTKIAITLFFITVHRLFIDFSIFYHAQLNKI